MKPRRPIQIGLIGPSLLCGGAERWIYNMIRHGKSSNLAWLLNVVVYPYIEPEMLGLLSDCIPTYADGELHFRGESRPASLDEMVKELRERASVILGWELDYATLQKLGDCNSKLINVFQRNAPHLADTAMPEHVLVAVSTEWHRLLPEHCDRIDIIPNGIELDRCVPTVPRNATRMRWGVPDDVLIAGAVGRIAAEKNHQAFARGIAALKGRAVGIIHGSRTEQSAPILAALEVTAGPRLHIYPPVEDIGSVLAALDVFVLPSHTEACPLALLEAFAAKIPVVATPSTFLLELEREHGKLTETISADASGPEVAGAIERANAMSEATLDLGRSIVFREYSARVNAARWEAKILDVATALSAASSEVGA